MIPNVAHFVWLGRELQYVHALAIRSALDRGGFDRVVLHHDADLGGCRWLRDLRDRAGLETRLLVERSVFERSGAPPAAIARVYERLHAPAARTNVLRAAILAAEGGLYLDLDTVTIRPLAPILDAGVVCGEERVALPACVVRSHDVSSRAGALARIAIRDLLRRAPSGWRAFRRIERFFPLAVNNAVLGATPGHPFIRRLLDAMVLMPPERAGERYALGTHLLQEQVARYRGDDLVVHPPEVFYPLAPEVSEHWFREARAPALSEVLSAQTRVVHWYASVRTARLLPSIDPAYIRRHAPTQLFSALAESLEERGHSPRS